MNKNIHVVHVGLSGFPHANKASINKQLAVAKGLQSVGIDTKILNKKGIYSRKNVPDAERQGIHMGIPYFTAYDSPYKPNSFYKRNLYKLKGMLYEIRFLAKLKANQQLDAAILDAHLFRNILFYRILSKVLGFVLVYHYVEMRSQMNIGSKKFLQRIGHTLIDNTVTKVFDGIFAISDLLLDAIKRKDPNMPVLKLPVMTNYELFKRQKPAQGPKYFLYCGNAAYQEVILFILDTYQDIDSRYQVCLYLVISGDKTKKKQIEDELFSRNLTDRVKIFSNLPYEQLVEFYIGALALLIPLRDTIQDKARFPHKISEYLASTNPVITTAYGEILHYFRDGENALVADEYDKDKFKEKMIYVLDNPQEAIEIGRKGYETGFSNFHYTQQGIRMKEFLSQLINARTK